jgi:hypothetical protein
MKFSGLHLHMILVVVIICIILYIFYVSKDIITLDSQVRQLRLKLDLLEQKTQQTQFTPAPTMSSVQLQVEQQDLVHVPIVEEVHGDNESVNSEKITEMLSAIAETNEEHVEEPTLVKADVEEETEIHEEEHVDNPEEMPSTTDENTGEERSLSLSELKDLCKKHGLFAKGGKKQLIELLKAHEILV